MRCARYVALDVVEAGVLLPPGKRTLPVGPLRCFATMTSAVPRSGVSGCRPRRVEEEDDVGVLFDRSRIRGGRRASVACRPESRLVG